MIPSALNVFSMEGYLILTCIIGGQVLASVSDHLNATLGIVIVGVISMLVGRLILSDMYFRPTMSQITFCWYKVIHW